MLRPLMSGVFSIILGMSMLSCKDRPEKNINQPPISETQKIIAEAAMGKEDISPAAFPQKLKERYLGVSSILRTRFKNIRESEW